MGSSERGITEKILEMCHLRHGRSWNGCCKETFQALKHYRCNDRITDWFDIQKITLRRKKTFVVGRV